VLSSREEISLVEIARDDIVSREGERDMSRAAKVIKIGAAKQK